LTLSLSLSPAYSELWLVSRHRCRVQQHSCCCV
jgi:hypothetical protein